MGGGMFSGFPANANDQPFHNYSGAFLQPPLQAPNDRPFHNYGAAFPQSPSQYDLHGQGYQQDVDNRSQQLTSLEDFNNSNEHFQGLQDPLYVNVGHDNSTELTSGAQAPETQFEPASPSQGQRKRKHSSEERDVPTESLPWVCVLCEKEFATFGSVKIHFPQMRSRQREPQRPRRGWPSNMSDAPSTPVSSRPVEDKPAFMTTCLFGIKNAGDNGRATLSRMVLWNYASPLQQAVLDKVFEGADEPARWFDLWSHMCPEDVDWSQARPPPQLSQDLQRYRAYQMMHATLKALIPKASRHAKQIELMN
ncbi:MAG: hypothetical protein MMC23_002988 [Stictis urceolatum]|nr:hypothetical protein [Stictis urceolata]